MGDLCVSETITELSYRTGWPLLGDHLQKSSMYSAREDTLLPARLRLVDAVVTPTALYASSCWTVWASTTSTSQSTWRRMLRKIVQVPRRHDESWVPYIRRSTRLAISKATNLGHESWADIQERRKRSLSERTQSDTQGKWSNRLLLWKPEFRTRAWRRTGRPVKRWADA